MERSEMPFNGATYSDEECISAFVIWQSTVSDDNPDGNKMLAAKMAGIERSKFNRLLNVHAARNLSGELPVAVAPGMEIKSHSVQTDANGEVKGRSIRMGQETGPEPAIPEDYLVERATLQVNGSGGTERQWLKLRKDADALRNLDDFFGDLETRIVERLEATQARAAAPTPLLLLPAEAEEQMNLHILPDLHLGMSAWAGTTGEDWGLDKAVATYQDAMVKIMDKTPAAEVGFVLGGGDLLHADSRENMTRRSKNVLDVDGDYRQILEAACDLLVFQISLAKKKYRRVEVRLLPGNHDEHATEAMSLFLAAWFRKDDQVHIDISASKHWVYQWGRTMLAATHGDTVKIHEMPSLMAARHAEVWGQTTYRYAHGFHIHHRSKGGDEAGGVQFETHASPSASDKFHSDGPWESLRSMVVISYGQKTGDGGRITHNI